jgi:chemotaxis protein methyltransferase CheR
MNDTAPNFRKEFILTDEDFLYLSNLANDMAGIKLSEAKRELVYGRVTKRLRALDLDSFKEYCDLLKDNSDDSEEFTHFINAITTNVTSFFRENHHFEYLANDFLPEIIRKNANTNQPRMRIWSAGCSSGMEPYSIAMVLRENIKNIESWDIKILATDLDSNILDVARNGIYSNDKVTELPAQRRNKWFRSGKGENEGTIKICSEIRNMVSYNQLNLTEEWPMRGPFDAIFCRNVTIYFDKETRVKLLDRFAEHLKPEGILFVGHSESLFGLTSRFATIGKTMHKKIS